MDGDTYLKGMDVFRRVTILVVLYKKRKDTLFIGLRDGGVGADDRIALGIYKRSGIRGLDDKA